MLNVKKKWSHKREVEQIELRMVILDMYSEFLK